MLSSIEREDGRYIELTGKTYRVKEELKMLGFQWGGGDLWILPLTQLELGQVIITLLEAGGEVEVLSGDMAGRIFNPILIKAEGLGV